MQLTQSNMNHFHLGHAVFKHECNPDKCDGKYLKNKYVSVYTSWNIQVLSHVLHLF